MAQFTLYRNLNQDSKEAYPYFVDVQSRLLEALNTRLVIPLTYYQYLDDSNISNLCPRVVINDENLVLLTHQMTNIPRSALKHPIASLEHLRDEIVSAIDFLVTGI
jgi:toxin CcdB